jgi:general transcription factor IIIA
MTSTTSVTTVINSASVLGKRKSRRSDTFILHLASSPELSSVLSDSDFEPPRTAPSGPPILVNGTLVANTKKRYKCSHNDCDKSYSKPSRLAEHERSHTGLVRNDNLCILHLLLIRV